MKACLESIVNQTLQDIEIIIVNDGSKDNSKEIILEYSQRDKRIIFIDCKNGGVSAARNAGIKRASGIYLGFVDADDWVSPFFYERLFCQAEQNKADLAIANVNIVQNGKETIPRLVLANDLIEVPASLEREMENVLSFKYDYANWNKIYLLAIVRKYDLQFNEKMTVWEDLLFNLSYLQFSSIAVVTSEPLYNYRVHSHSAMSNAGMNISKEYNLLYDNFTSFCEARGFDAQLAVFKRERSKTWVGNLIHFIKLSSQKESDFLQFVRRFNKEVKELKRDIYTYDDFKWGELNAIEIFLLRNKLFSFFSFIIIGKIFLRTSVRNIFRA